MMFPPGTLVKQLVQSVEEYFAGTAAYQLTRDSTMARHHDIEYPHAGGVATGTTRFEMK